MDNITPPQISEERLNDMADGVLKAAGSALRHYITQKSKDDIASAMRAALAERDRQWLERLEYQCHVDQYGFMVEGEERLQTDTPLYRIKEQG